MQEPDTGGRGTRVITSWWDQSFVVFSSSGSGLVGVNGNDQRRAPWLGEDFGGAEEGAWAKGGAGSSNSKGLRKSGGHLEEDGGQDCKVCGGGGDGVRLASVAPEGDGVHDSPLRR